MAGRYIDAGLRAIVVQRAAGRCEYCGLAQVGQEASFHVDHVIPVKQGGATVGENLALACVSCSLRKAARLTAVDPETNEEVRIFHPRQDSWRDHFEWRDVLLLGRTPTGRATVEALRMNRVLTLSIRRQQALMGRHLPASHK